MLVNDDSNGPDPVLTTDLQDEVSYPGKAVTDDIFAVRQCYQLFLCVIARAYSTDYNYGA